MVWIKHFQLTTHWRFFLHQWFLKLSQQWFSLAIVYSLTPIYLSQRPSEGRPVRPLGPLVMPSDDSVNYENLLILWESMKKVFSFLSSYNEEDDGIFNADECCKTFFLQNTPTLQSEFVIVYFLTVNISPCPGANIILSLSLLNPSISPAYLSTCHPSFMFTYNVR